MNPINLHHSEKKDYEGIDLWKYIMALAVVAIHYKPFFKDVEYPLPIKWFIELAVPFFFTVSGFLLGGSLNKCSSRDEVRSFLISRSKHFFRIFFLWLLIYLPLTFYYYLDQGTEAAEAISHYVYNIIFFGESPYAWPLWFIYSMAIVYGCLSFCWGRKWRLYLLSTLFLISYLSVYCATIYPGLAPEIVHILKTLTARTLGGGIYILTGLLFYRWRNLHKGRLLLSILLIAVSLIIFFLKLPFWQPIGGLGVVISGLYISLPRTPIWLGLRYQSMWIYYIHMYILTAIVFIFHIINMRNHAVFLITIYTATITAAFILYKLQTISYFSKIKVLIK